MITENTKVFCTYCEKQSFASQWTTVDGVYWECPLCGNDSMRQFTSDTNFDDVKTFHRKFGLGDGTLPLEPGPREVAPEAMLFRIKAMIEELHEEFIPASYTNDHLRMADALIDLVYFAMGTALTLGYPWQELWDAVQKANMYKMKAETAAASKRGYRYDVIKPPGWESPDEEQRKILEKYGF